jgi:catechol 2,3-dioxygenase-like lactoylglutathione lyase family enzyme
VQPRGEAGAAKGGAVLFQVKSIDHVEVFVRDIAVAEQWYRDVLGLTRVAAWDPEPVMVGRGGTKLALFLASPGSRRKTSRSPATREGRGNIHRIAFLTDRRGLAAAQKRLEEHGVKVRGPVDHGTWRSIYFTDPDGIRLEITHPVRGGRPR